MHGSIFVLLKRFVEHAYEYTTWINLLEEAGIEHPNYQLHEMYPTSELFANVQKASETTGVPHYELMEQF